MPIEARGWFNSAGRLLLLNAGFSNGRTAHLRLFATTWCLTFGYDASLLQNAILEEA
jgi:hypothetical protein